LRERSSTFASAIFIYRGYGFATDGLRYSRGIPRRACKSLADVTHHASTQIGTSASSTCGEYAYCQFLLWYLDSTVGWPTAEWRGHDKPELSLSGNAGDSLADYDADFLQCSTTWLVLYHSYVVDNGPAESLYYPDVPTFLRFFKICSPLSHHCRSRQEDSTSRVFI
jgi:hypothetical protein